MSLCGDYQHYLHVAEMWLKWTTEWSGRTRGLGGWHQDWSGSTSKDFFCGAGKEKLDIYALSFKRTSTHCRLV